MSAPPLYGDVAIDEQELTVRLDRATRRAVVWSTWTDRSRMLQRKYGLPTKTVVREGKVVSARWELAVNLVCFRRLRPVTDRPQNRPGRASSPGKSGTRSRDLPGGARGVAAQGGAGRSGGSGGALPPLAPVKKKPKAPPRQVSGERGEQHRVHGERGRDPLSASGSGKDRRRASE